MPLCDSPIYCSNHSDSEWMFCVLCRTRIQSASALKRAQNRAVSWPTKPADLQQPIKDTSSCSINEAISNIVQYLGSTTRGCKKYYNGQPQSATNNHDKQHCSRFHVEKEDKKSCFSNPLMDGCLTGLDISVAPGTYSITAGEWGGQQTQTHIVNLMPGQSANLDFVF